MDSPYGTVWSVGTPRPRSLTPADWAVVAFRAIARGGVDAVAVEPLAAELGTTKGSFYWHFKNRDALIDAALDEWERRLTNDVIARLDREPDPALRLKNLFAAAFELGSTERSAEIALLANPDHPVAGRRLRQVARRRIDYMAHQLELLGWDPAGALDRAVLLSYLYIGYLQSAHVMPDVISKDARRRHAELIFDSLVAARPPSRPLEPGVVRPG